MKWGREYWREGGDEKDERRGDGVYVHLTILDGVLQFCIHRL